MFRKVAAVVLAVSIVPAAAFACAKHHAAKVESASADQKVMLAQADSVKKDVAKSTAQTQTATASKKMKPKAKSLSQPKTVNSATTTK